MLNNLSLASINNKRKVQLLAVGGLLFMLLIYYWAVKPTLDMLSENKRINQQIALSENAPQKMQDMEHRLLNLQKLTKNYTLDSTESENELVGVLSMFCNSHKLELYKVHPVSLQEEKNYFIETSTFSVRGNYTDLLKLVYDLEQIDRKGRVVSTSFHSFVDPKIRKMVLETTIYIQNIKYK